MRQHEPAARPPLVIWMADLHVWCEHAMTLEQAEATVQARTGIYESLCETTFLPEAMTARPGPRCQECERRYQRWLDAWRPAKKPLLRRLFRARRGCPR